MRRIARFAVCPTSRCTVLMALGTHLFIMGAGGLLAQHSTSTPTSTPSAIENEHRLTGLEVRQADLDERLNELKRLIYGLLAGTATLCGEAALRVMKRKG